MSAYKNYRCAGCGVNGLVPAQFKPAHFTGSLSHLSAGYCTIECARKELNRLLVERTREWNKSYVLSERGELG